MSRLITFDPRAANEPLASSIEANLLKKFGAPSWTNTGGAVTDEWLFQGKSRVPCPSGGCAAQPTRKNADFGLGSTPLLASNVGGINLSYGGGGPYSLGAAEDRKVQVVLLCGNSISTTLDPVSMTSSMRDRNCERPRSSGTIRSRRRRVRPPSERARRGIYRGWMQRRVLCRAKTWRRPPNGLAHDTPRSWPLQ